MMMAAQATPCCLPIMHRRTVNLSRCQKKPMPPCLAWRHLFKHQKNEHMKTINGIPVVWDEAADEKMLGGLFALNGNASSLESIQAKGAYESPFEKGPFGSANPFNNGETPCPCKGFLVESGIDFNKLVAAITSGIIFTEKFDYRKYLFPEPMIIGQTNTSPLPNVPKPDNGVTYVDEKGSKKTILFSGWINTESCTVNNIPAFSIKVSKTNVSFGIRFLYKEIDEEGLTKMRRSYGTDIAGFKKFSAVAMETDNADDFFYLLSKLKNESLLAVAMGILKEKFDLAFADAGESPKHLNFLYKYAPLEVIQNRTDALLGKDLLILLKYDQSSWVKDSSNAMVKILAGFNNLKALYEKLEADPALVISLYDFINGKQAGLYCTFLDCLCKLFSKPERLRKSHLKALLGKEYTMDTDIFWSSKNSVHVTIKRFSAERLSERIHNSEFDGFISETVFDEAALHPLDIIQLYNADTGDIRTVPAIYVKYLAEMEQWAKIVEALTITLDLVSILLSAGTLAAGARGLIYILSIADIGLATTDLLMKSDEVKKLLRGSGKIGEWFVAHWDEIYGGSAFFIMGPLLAQGLIHYAPAMINWLKRQVTDKAREMAALLQRMLLSLKVEVYLWSLEKTLLVSFEPFSIVAKLMGGFLKTGMEEAGILLSKETENGIRCLYYEGEKVMEGTVSEIRSAMRRVFEKKGADLVRFFKYLKELKGFLRISLRTEEHLTHGHIRIDIIDSRAPKRLADGSLNPARIIEAYEYIPGKGRLKSTIKKGTNVAIRAAGGSHVLHKFNNKFIRIVENMGTMKLPTGESVRLAKIEYWVEELGQWVAKEGVHTFWPQGWSLNKIKSIILEASENIILRDGTKAVGRTKKGIFIEMYFDELSKEIKTAYITFK
jgi:hypothetical protein